MHVEGRGCVVGVCSLLSLFESGSSNSGQAWWWVPFPATSRCSKVGSDGRRSRDSLTANLKDAAYQRLSVRSYHKQFSVIMSGSLGILTS